MRVKSRRKRTQNIYMIIEDLENPNVRLEDNSDYQVDLETLGILYAYFISKVDVNRSPGIMLARKPDLTSKALQEFQKRFQSKSRDFLYDRLGELSWHESTAEDLRNKYFPEKDRTDFTLSSIEGLVNNLTREGEFEVIGKALKRGARDYHQLASRKRMPNYRFAAEYQAILNALRDSAKR